MKIVLDAMGGDFASIAPVNGAIEALKRVKSDTEIILIGDQVEIKEALKGFTSPNLNIVHASQSIKQIGRAHVELQSHHDLVCRLLLEKKNKKNKTKKQKTQKNKRKKTKKKTQKKNKNK